MFLVPMTRQGHDLARSLDRLFDDSFERMFSSAGGSDSTRKPAVDVAETDRTYTVTMDMPGVDKPEVQVHIEGRRVTVQARTQREQEREQADRVVYRERSPASYACSFTVPVEIDQAESQAKLEHGVLTLTLPKRGATKAAQIAVN